MFSADDSSEEISARALSEPNTEINENTSGIETPEVGHT